MLKIRSHDFNANLHLTNADELSRVPGEKYLFMTKINYCNYLNWKCQLPGFHLTLIGCRWFADFCITIEAIVKYLEYSSILNAYEFSQDL